MVNSNNAFKKQPGEKASEIAIRCLVAIIILDVIMAFIAILIPDNSFTLVKLYASFALFLLPILITIGNLRYIERYNMATKVFSWISIACSVLFILLGLVLIWNGNSVSALDTANDIPSSNYSTNDTQTEHLPAYITKDYDDDSDSYDYDDDYYYDNYDYDDDYYDYDDDYDDYYDYKYNYDYVAPINNTPYYTIGSSSIATSISPTLKAYLVSLIMMLSTFFIASCLKYKNSSVLIIGLKIASIVCIACCCLVAISFLLFPIPFSEMAVRFAILAVVLSNSGFDSWLALIIIAHKEKHKVSNNEAKIPQDKHPATASPDTPAITPEPTPTDTTTSKPTPTDTTPTASKPAPSDTLTTSEPTPSNTPSTQGPATTDTASTSEPSPTTDTHPTPEA
ncbi:hypothetical protein IKF30_01005 [Candidatus Saccharibacteria bacterium]|nr:hypothetical protein [Candidatus Saccharibacteria bacterium]